MWRCAVLWQAATLLAIGATLDFRFLNPRRQTSAAQVNCYDYNMPTDDRFARAIAYGWRPQKLATTKSFTASTVSTYPTFSTLPILNLNEISRRIDNILPSGNDIVKEHAKLVQDINGLRQVVFVAPLVDNNRDYDESIFHEIIETTSTTTARPTTARAVIKTAKPSSIPVILLGGASQRQIVRSQPLKFPKPTISLIGTSVSPLGKHPYPFVMQGSSQKPIKVCMTSMPVMYATTRKPNLWQRLLNALIPR